MRQLRQTASSRLNKLRQSTLLAVAMTSALLLLWGGDGAEGLDNTNGEAVANLQADSQAADEVQDLPADPSLALEEATSTLREMLFAF